MDEGGEVVEDICKWLPYWALELARIYRDRGDLYFAFNVDAVTSVAIFWPDEEVENWYL